MNLDTLGNGSPDISNALSCDDYYEIENLGVCRGLHLYLVIIIETLNIY